MEALFRQTTITIKEWYTDTGWTKKFIPNKIALGYDLNDLTSSDLAFNPELFRTELNDRVAQYISFLESNIRPYWHPSEEQLINKEDFKEIDIQRAPVVFVAESLQMFHKWFFLSVDDMR